MKKNATRRTSGARDRAGSRQSGLAARAEGIYRRLQKQYPRAACALQHRNPFQLLVATILSAQCTDTRVNMVTPELFRKYPGPKEMASASQEDLESLIRSTGFYRNKAKALRRASGDIAGRFGGRVPDRMEELLTLHGVARKTANVVLGNAFQKNEGVVVDTHVGRLSRRMGLTKQDDPVKVERELMALFPRGNWTILSHLLIWHGREVCAARKPECGRCVVAELCPRIGVDSPRPFKGKRSEHRTSNTER